MIPIIKEAREKYHKSLLESILTVDANGVASNADKSSRLSKEIAKGITDILIASTQEKSLGQTSGNSLKKSTWNIFVALFLNCQICVLVRGKY